MENGRCAKNWGTGKCHSCFQSEEEGRFKKLYTGRLGKNPKWLIKGIVHEKPERETAITRRQQNFTHNWSYLPLIIPKCGLQQCILQGLLWYYKLCVGEGGCKPYKHKPLPKSTPTTERFPAAWHRTLSLAHPAEHFHMKLNEDSNNTGMPIKSWEVTVLRKVGDTSNGTVRSQRGLAGVRDLAGCNVLYLGPNKQLHK